MTTDLYPQGKTAIIYGQVKDFSGEAIENANIVERNSGLGTTSGQNGNYRLVVPAGKAILLKFSYQQNSRIIEAGPLSEGESKKLDVFLSTTVSLSPVDISMTAARTKVPMQRVDVRTLDMFPSATEKVSTLIGTFAGVSKTNELSSTYSVRGGNYDENLVYINDIEIYRPFLIRSGQQEGLPVFNSDLIETIDFSAGGFEAKYGDKMASVLDIKYKRPRETAANVTLSLLGLTAHAEGTSENRRLTYLIGLRQRTNRYFLNSLDVEGDYNTTFSDFQSYFTYDLGTHLKAGFFSYFGYNYYNVIPQTQETSYGTHDLVLRLKVYFDGQEKTSYSSTINAFDINWTARDSLKLKWIVSLFNTKEKEYFDIMGQYWLAQLETDPRLKEEYGDIRMNLGVGTFLNHARNKLEADILTIQHKGERIYPNTVLNWGISANFENINDYLKEWKLIDSSDYSIPINTEKLMVNSYLKTLINLSSLRYSGHLQQSYLLGDSNQAWITAGIRCSYWDYNNEFFATPRIQFVVEPFRRRLLRSLVSKTADTSIPNIQFRAAAGMYYQPPFYRELRGRAGVLNSRIRAQKSYQVLAGSDVIIRLWNRKFKWTTEIWYKYFNDLIPYDVEDIRIRYFARNNANGYAMGLDMQLYGAFVRELPSWISLSLLKTMENLDDDWYYKFIKDNDNNIIDTQVVYPGMIPRPTDQIFKAGIFFQDFLPKNPRNKVHLNFLYSTPLPFGPPQFEQLRNRYRMRSYKRVDIGFSHLLMSTENRQLRQGFSKSFESVWLTAEIFNFFGVRNVVSYFWVKDVNNNLWGVPNYLTARRINVSVMVKF